MEVLALRLKINIILGKSKEKIKIEKNNDKTI